MKRRDEMKRIIGIGAFLFTLFFVGCGELDAPSNENVIGGEIVVDLDGETIKQLLISEQTPNIDENSTVYGYKAYKIPYTTTDEEGNSVEVSGLMVVPTGLPDVVYSTLGLSMVSDSHGTIFANSEAPTVIANSTNAPDGASILLTSLGGFVTLEADYIGFGDSLSHYHPFVLKKSLANATIDFIEAGKRFALANGIHLNSQLFVTGYSEGGYSAMATLQKIEQDAQMQVTLAIPMAGPYDLNTTAFGVFSQPTLQIPSFMANVGYAYATAYEQDVASVINEPFASQLEELLGGDFNRTQIDASLTTTTTGEDGLFTTSFVHTFLTDETQWFRQAVLENSVHNWVPKTSVKLLHCMGDEVIPYAISQHTQTTMQMLGAEDVSLIPVEVALTQDVNTTLRYQHTQCATFAYALSTQMFAQIREDTVGY